MTKKQDLDEYLVVFRKVRNTAQSIMNAQILGCLQGESVELKHTQI